LEHQLPPAAFAVVKPEAGLDTRMIFSHPSLNVIRVVLQFQALLQHTTNLEVMTCSQSHRPCALRSRKPSIGLNQKGCKDAWQALEVRCLHKSHTLSICTMHPLHGMSKCVKI